MKTVISRAPYTPATLVIAPQGLSTRADYYTGGSGDQTVINAAISALPSGGGTIFLREGTYTLSALIAIAKNNVTIEGTGSSTILRLANSANQTMIQSGHASTQYSGLRFKNLYFDGNGTNQSVGQSTVNGWIDNFSLARPINNMIIENCHFYNAAAFGICNWGDNVQIKGCYFDTWGTVGQSAAIANSGNNAGSTQGAAGGHMTISDCFFTSAGSINEFVDSSYDSKLIVKGCHFKVPDSFTGLQVIHAYGTNEIISDNYFDIGNNQAAWTNTFVAVHGGSNISNNVFVFKASATSTSAAIAPAFNSVVKGNVIQNAAKGIYLENSFGYRTVVTNNWISSNYTAIELNNSFQSVISNNYIQATASPAGSINAIYIHAGASGNTITGNRIMGDNGGTKFLHGIFENASGDGPNTIVGNHVTGTSSTGISTLNSSTVNANNIIS